MNKAIRNKSDIPSLDFIIFGSVLITLLRSIFIFYICLFKIVAIAAARKE
jgi:hypothetical protein